MTRRTDTEPCSRDPRANSARSMAPPRVRAAQPQMTDSMPIYLRAHTVAASDKFHPNRKSNKPEKYPEYVLVFDCETRLDAGQALILCVYQICRRNAGGLYVCVEEGLVFADEATANEQAIIREYSETHKTDAAEGYPVRLRVLSRSEFVEQVFYKLAYEADALVCGFNLSFDLSRLAVNARKARKYKAWSLILSQYEDAKTGRLHENRFRARIIIEPKDSKAAFIRFAGRNETKRKTA
jgi:hypothetical protein